jgi:hypothetical protein
VAVVTTVRKKGHKKSQCWKLHGKPAWILEREAKKEMKKAQQNRAGGKVSNDGNVDKGNAAFMVFEKNHSLDSDMKVHRWIVDSGANPHVSGNEQLFEELREVEKGSTMSIPTNEAQAVTGAGEVTGCCVNSLGGEVELSLTNVQHVPSIPYNLLSVNKVLESGGEVVFSMKRGSFITTRKWSSSSFEEKWSSFWIGNVQEDPLTCCLRSCGELQKRRFQVVASTDGSYWEECVIKVK